MKYLSWICFAVVLFILGYLGTLTAYRQHLLFDVSVYYTRALYFFQVHNFTGVGNEYLPVATTFFLIFSPIFFLANSLEAFELAFKMGNCLLLLGLAVLIYREKGPKALLLFDALTLAAGPIILYRFELLVILSMILAILRFEKKDYIGSSMILSLGMLTKLYPLLLLPYFLYLSWRQKSFKHSVYYGLVFVATALVGILFYFFITQTGINELAYGLNYHKDKPLGLDGPLGAIVQLVNFIKMGHPAPMVARNFTWGVDDNYVFLPMPVLTFLWVIPVSLMYGWLLFSKVKKFDWKFLIVFLMSFFIFSKLFSPQYWLWVVFLLPFLEMSKAPVIAVKKSVVYFERSEKKLVYWLMIGFAFLATLLMQFIYPLNYYDFLGYFNNGTNGYLFWIYQLEMLCIITTGTLALVYFWRTTRS